MGKSYAFAEVAKYVGDPNESKDRVTFDGMEFHESGRYVYNYGGKHFRVWDENEEVPSNASHVGKVFIAQL